jgi:hypothetical protein
VEGFPGKVDRESRKGRRLRECQKVTELAPLRAAALVPEEVQEWVRQDREEDVAPELEQALVENVYVRSAERSFAMRLGSPVPTKIVPSAGQRW